MLEVCIDCVESGISACRGGAGRIELCSSLSLGGITPSVGLLRVVKKNVNIPVFVMIRPRAGDFLYSSYEIDVMKADIEVLKENGADGFVFGVLRSDGSVDKEACKGLLAIDVCRHILQALDVLIEMGFQRVLTSGGQQTAIEGSSVICEMMKHSAGRIIVMPGSGVSEANIEWLLRETGAREFHGSARVAEQSLMEYKGNVSMSSTSAEEQLMLTSECKVQTIVSLLRGKLQQENAIIQVH